MQIRKRKRQTPTTAPTINPTDTELELLSAGSTGAGNKM
jgi:hypothetical protein